VRYSHDPVISHDLVLEDHDLNEGAVIISVVISRRIHGVAIMFSMMAVVIKISAVVEKRIDILVLEWQNMSRVMVLVFINWNLYKKNIVRVLLSKR